MGKKKKAESVIFLCDGKKCCKYNKDVKDCFKDLLKENGLKKQIDIQKTKCQGMCKQAPVVCIHKNECIGKVTTHDVKKIIQKHIA
jgi:(2Fe-2S) ferredoxin